MSKHQKYTIKRHDSHKSNTLLAIRCFIYMLLTFMKIMSYSTYISSNFFSEHYALGIYRDCCMQCYSVHSFSLLHNSALSINSLLIFIHFFVSGHSFPGFSITNDVTVINLLLVPRCACGRERHGIAGSKGICIFDFNKYCQMATLANYPSIKSVENVLLFHSSPSLLV